MGTGRKGEWGGWKEGRGSEEKRERERWGGGVKKEGNGEELRERENLVMEGGGT